MSLISKISAKDFDQEWFVKLALEDGTVRDDLVDWMVSHPEIMVYYHAYYVISKASRKEPALFYVYWDPIAGLLDHQSSYHRNFALDVIGNLAGVDDEDRFLKIDDRYLALINDPKFNTGNECIKNLPKIYRSKSRLRGRILELLLDLDVSTNYSDKQRAILNYDVLDFLDGIYADLNERSIIEKFILDQQTSISPKTRKKAEQLTGKYSL